MTLFLAIAGFVFCSAGVIYAGARLSFYGNRIAELTGLGKAWLGLILMATVTSLPELVNGISSVAFVHAPDLAAGDIFGSCMFNLLILSVLDTLLKKPITSQVHVSHVFAGACGIVLITLSGIGIFMTTAIPTIGWISIITPVIFIIYLLAVRLIFRFEKKTAAEIFQITEAESKRDSRELRKILIRYGINSLIVVVCALFLPFFGEHIAVHTGLGDTFFGTLFVAMTTSMPELVVSITAIRLNSLDMAVGNLFGSNIFNILILGIDDVFYTKGSLFSNLSDHHLLTILVVIMMTSVAAIGLLFKAERKRWLLAADTFIIFLLYTGLMLTLYFTR